MESEVDFWNRLLLLESSQSIVYLDVVDPRWERVSLRLAVHDRNFGNGNEGLSGPPSSSKIDRSQDFESGAFFGSWEKGEAGRHTRNRRHALSALGEGISGRARLGGYVE